VIRTDTVVCANLTLVGNDFDINYVTESLGVAPTYTRSKDEILGNGRRFGHTEWGIGTDCEESLDIEVQFAKISNQFKGKEHELAKVSKYCNAEWSILIVIKIENGDIPAMVFTRSMLDFCNKIDAEIGFDIYVLSLYEETG